MKTHAPIHTTLKRGFTLVELLVVIAIIAVLASLIFAVGPKIIDRTRQTQASSFMKGLETSINSYFTEYNRYPSPATYTTDTTLRSNSDILNILTATSGNGNTNHEKNPRRTVYLETKISKSGRAGVITAANSDGSPAGSLVDPWGKEYYIRLDYDYDDTLTNEPLMPTPAGHTGDYRPLRIGIWSGGKDKIPSGTNLSDDVYTY